MILSDGVFIIASCQVRRVSETTWRVQKNNCTLRWDNNFEIFFFFLRRDTWKTFLGYDVFLGTKNFWGEEAGFLKMGNFLLSLGDLGFQVGNDFGWDAVQSLSEVSVVDSVVRSELEVGDLQK